jgi:hypothetical protein
MSSPANKRVAKTPAKGDAVPKPKMSRKDRGSMGALQAAAAKHKAKEDKKKLFIEAFASAACNISQGCRKIGITRQTFFNWKAEDPDFANAIKEEQDAMVDFAESMLMKKIKAEDNTAIIFFLKCRAKDRGYIERVEHSGPNGSPIRHGHGLDMQWLNEELPEHSLLKIVEKLAIPRKG